ncbi:hypothetical protein LshimejAT787_0701650 [Lyophyllum shimeji]|uniref:Uncharacterized protein n=1 Tax=Lyophyllum shimeji TaxID=47721 RepID=A0A9P3UQ10_LYOSH|nr:hypothetical protein LshimejAT787_0701650 [Lyophyllum shimeji]
MMVTFELERQYINTTSSFLAVPQFQATPYPNSTGIKLQNGFKRVYIQPLGNHDIRVRASLLRGSTGNEPSAFLDPPLEGPGGNQGLAHDIVLPFWGSAAVPNTVSLPHTPPSSSSSPFNRITFVADFEPLMLTSSFPRAVQDTRGPRGLAQSQDRAVTAEPQAYTIQHATRTCLHASGLGPAESRPRRGEAPVDR